MTNFKAIEEKWQNKWEEKEIFKVKESTKKKYYVLEMFPYPSGSGLHLGHALVYSMGDIFTRFKRMQGLNVLHPMGFDSFGLPAENAAIKANAHPKKFTEEAIVNYIQQMKSLGLSYDWSRKVITSDPEYYKWDQWIFLQMFKKGLAYKKEAPVNWCPSCNTVLANEQAQLGKCDMCDTKVEIKNLNQWFLKTTEYADELYEGINKLKNWPTLVKKLQTNWIGKSYGTEIKFKINDDEWPIFTTRPDTLYGVTFLVVSAQHSRLMELVTDKEKAKVEKFVKKLSSVSEEDIEQLEKEGVFTGSYANHPLTNEKIPVYAGNFVLASYGSGMVMAVPAHDQRDFEFAKKYKIPIKIVITPENKSLNLKEMKGAYSEPGILTNSDKFDRLKSEKAKEEITKYLKSKKLGKKQVNFRLKDWLISRQRFWGTPIPIVHCEQCGEVPVPEKDLPVLLPEEVKLKKGKNALETYKPFLETTCPKCKRKAKRETDTMDTFANSSWYYLRYCDPNNKNKIFDKNKANYWCPVDTYIGGKEHACMHLIYIRFYTKFLRDLKLLNFDEPAKTLFNQGMLLGPDGNKMSKSKGNVILPEDVSHRYGMDTARLFLVSVASPDKDIEWSEKGIEGSLRFINRVLDRKIRFRKSSIRTQHKINKAIMEITENIDDFKYNIAVIQLRELFDSFEKEISRKDYESALKLLAPFCPHIAEELWEKMGNKKFISLESWPKYDAKKINPELDVLDLFISDTIKDIHNISKFVKTKPKKVTISVSEEWKYKAIEKIKKSMEKTYDISTIIKAVMDKQHAKEISKLVPSFVKNPKKLPQLVLTQEKEFKRLAENIERLKKEFNLEIEIKKDDPKAMPGKPSILFE
jgi:leucyl-tRNA synthetase